MSFLVLPSYPASDGGAESVAPIKTIYRRTDSVIQFSDRELRVGMGTQRGRGNAWVGVAVSRMSQKMRIRKVAACADKLPRIARRETGLELKLLNWPRRPTPGEQRTHPLRRSRVSDCFDSPRTPESRVHKYLTSRCLTNGYAMAALPSFLPSFLPLNDNNNEASFWFFFFSFPFLEFSNLSSINDRR